MADCGSYLSSSSASRNTSKPTRDYVSQLTGYVLRDTSRCYPVLPSKQHDHQQKRDQGHHRQDSNDGQHYPSRYPELQRNPAY